MKYNKQKSIWITKQATFYKNIGNGQKVGFSLSEYHNHAIVVTHHRKWYPEFNEWHTYDTDYEVYADFDNLNDQQTLDLINKLESTNLSFCVDSKIKNEQLNISAAY